MFASGQVLALWLLALQPSEDVTASGSPIVVAPMTQTTSPEGGVAADRLDRAVAEGLARGNIDIEVLGGGCHDRACWIEQARARGRTHVLLPSLEQHGPDHHIHIEVVEVDSGAVIIVTNEICEICGEDEVVRTVADEAAELIPRLRRLEVEPARLVISGRPSGATVEIDGREVGTLPWEGEVEPGEHALRISQEGYVALRRSITASRGLQELVDMNLQPEPRIDDPRARRVRIGVGSGLVAVGVVGVATGAGLFVLDGRPYRRDCGPGVVDVNGRCPQMYEATGPAVAGVVVGGAALVAGVALLAHTLRRRGRAPVEGTLRPAGRGVTFALRF